MEDNSDHPLHSSHTVVNTNTVQIYLSKSLGSRSTGTNHVVMQMFAVWCWCGTMLAKLTWIQLRWFPASAPHWSQWRSQRKVISQSSCSALYGPFSSVAGSSALSWWRTSCTPTTQQWWLCWAEGEWSRPKIWTSHLSQSTGTWKMTSSSWLPPRSDIRRCTPCIP